MYRLLTILFFGTAFAFSSCGPGHKDYPGPQGYDMQTTHQVKLPIELDEISGLAYYAKDTSVFAINDENGLLYKIGLGQNQTIRRWEFSKGADFEDIAMVDTTFYVLQSNGTIYKVDFNPQGQMFTKEIPFQYNEESEFEILYYDSLKKKLILICKDCDSDKKSFLTTFSFDPATNKFDTSFTINVQPIAAAINEKKIRFKPSAAAINPRDSLLYIVSAINKLIVVTDRNGNFKKAYPINPSLFKQPEGLTFTPAGAIIISNEAAGIGVANILIFSHGKPGS